MQTSESSGGKHLTSTSPA